MPQAHRTPRLLVSVRDAVEAEAALAGGAHLIDVKEPARGALGRADDATIAAVVRRWGTVVLLDTFDKSAGRTLLDCLALREIVRLCRWCRAAGVRVALAGSLGPSHLGRLRPAGPDWFGVRGAACADARRDGPVSAGKVRDLVGLLAASVRMPARGS